MMIILDQIPRLQKYFLGSRLPFNATACCIKRYRVVVSEKYYEYRSIASGPGLRTGISASLIPCDQTTNGERTHMSLCCWGKHNQKLQQFQRC